MSAASAAPLGGRSALQLLDLCFEATVSPLHSLLQQLRLIQMYKEEEAIHDTHHPY